MKLNKPLTADQGFPVLRLAWFFQDLGKLPESGIWEKDNLCLLPESEEKSMFLLTFIGEKDRFKTRKRPQKQC